MKLQKMIMYFVLTLCKPFLLFLKINPNKITFISLESTILTGDFQLVAVELEKTRQYELNYILVKFEKSLKGYVEYFFSCIHQFFEINTSKVVILDYNNFVCNSFKRKGVIVLQLWHATGAIKKFGNDAFRDYKINGYDALIVNSEAFKPIFSSAFNMDENNVYVTGIPKTDRFFMEEKKVSDRLMLEKIYPQIKGKKVILYAPTFRGKLFHGFDHTTMDFNKVISQLSDDYVILYKMHPLISDISFGESDRIVNCNTMSIRKLFSITDILISDYSAIIYDFSVFNKPMIFFCPDLEEYQNKVGIYFDYKKEMPGPICEKEEEVVLAIKQDEFDLNQIEMFKNKYFQYFDGKSTQRVVQLIDQLMK